jgi:hypothetical protein
VSLLILVACVLDNGGYYHYSTGSNKSVSYEEVLPRVKAYHDSIGVPFGHWQFDSWFYPKDGAVGSSGGGGAVTNWTALSAVFPAKDGLDGMRYIQSQLQLPMVMHNRQWSPTSDYVKNLPQFTWYSSKKAAIPTDPPAFFTWFFQQQQGWGLTMYEQDWMSKEYDQVDALRTNISMGDLWLKGMAQGAGSSNRTVQYCMPYPNDVLSASAYPEVTNARATDDYLHVPLQWAIAPPAMFYWAIGILPFKDGFYSSTSKQTGGQTVGPEDNPDRAGAHYYCTHYYCTHYYCTHCYCTHCYCTHYYCTQRSWLHSRARWWGRWTASTCSTRYSAHYALYTMHCTNGIHLLNKVL